MGDLILKQSEPLEPVLYVITSSKLSHSISCWVNGFDPAVFIFLFICSQYNGPFDKQPPKTKPSGIVGVTVSYGCYG